MHLLINFTKTAWNFTTSKYLFQFPPWNHHYITCLQNRAHSARSFIVTSEGASSVAPPGGERVQKVQLLGMSIMFSYIPIC